MSASWAAEVVCSLWNLRRICNSKACCWLAVLQVGSRISDEARRAIYPELLKRLDDSSNKVSCCYTCCVRCKRTRRKEKLSDSSP